MWRQCDLVIDDRQIDVKNGRNARRHDSDAFDNYIEFCVPRYKHDDRNDQHVWIVGALSNYLWASSLMCADNFPYSTQIRILGWTQKKLIQDLSERFNIPNHFNITFSRRGNSYTYLPPWAFVYPEKFYSSRDGYLASIFSDNQLVNILDMTYPISYPFFIAFGKDPFDTGILKPVESWEVSFAELLTNWTQEQEHKHSLPFLFASVLNHFIHMVLADRNEISNFSPDRYRKFLYVMGLNKFPLMIYDPLETINNLIKVLDLLWTSDTDKLLEYKSFKLTNALILKGYKDSNEEADTLVAYCGGRLEDNSACGYYPLVAGQDPTCPNCHHLICSDCNYCSYECCPDGHGFARPELTEHYSHKFTRVFDHPSPYDLEEADDDIPF